MDSQSRTPLHWAVAVGHPDAIKRLLSHGADPNIQDVWGNTTLHLAVLNLDLGSDVVQALITAGADVNIRNIDVSTISACPS
jgi:ankyrin repeat protein